MASRVVLNTHLWKYNDEQYPLTDNQKEVWEDATEIHGENIIYLFMPDIKSAFQQQYLSITYTLQFSRNL